MTENMTEEKAQLGVPAPRCDERRIARDRRFHVTERWDTREES